MKQIIFLSLLVLFFATTKGQNVKRGYKQLEKPDYEKAMEAFQKILETDSLSPAANLGMAIIYADTNFTGFNLVNAWKYAVKTNKNVNSLTQDDIETIGEYFLNTEVRKTSRPVKKKIQMTLDRIEDQLIKYVREENNLAIAYAVLKNFPDFKYYENVVHIKNQLEFRKYEKQNTLEGYVYFIEHFPDAAQIKKALKYRDELAFKEVQKTNTIEAYNAYMKQYPDALDYQAALKARNSLAFQKAKQANTMEAFNDFIDKYPDALEVADAKVFQQKLLYEYAKRIQTLEAYDNFIRKYPAGEQYVDIFNLKSLDLGMKSASALHIAGNNMLWARAFDNYQNTERAGDVAVTSNNDYIIAGSAKQTDSTSYDAWVLKLNSDGKMIWNKFYGKSFEDHVSKILLNSKDEIVLAGYTYLTADSSSKESWIFKLDQDGKMLWNRSFGKFKVAAICIDGDDNIILGGSEPNDSSVVKGAMAILNDDGKRIWKRIYTTDKPINSVIVDQKSNMGLIAGNWVVSATPKGYIQWENLQPVSDSLLSMVYGPSGQYICFGIRDSSENVVCSFDATGKKNFEKLFDNNSQLKHITSIMLNNGTLLIGGYSPVNSEIDNISQNGDIIGKLNINLSAIPKGMCEDKQKNILIIYSTGDLLLAKYSGLNF